MRGSRRARCRQGLGTLRPMTGAHLETLHLVSAISVYLHCRFQEFSECLQFSAVAASSSFSLSWQGMFQVIHEDMLITVLCGDCLVRVVGSGLRRCVQSQVRSPR